MSALRRYLLGFAIGLIALAAQAGGQSVVSNPPPPKTGTSGATVPLLNGSGITFTNGIGLGGLSFSLADALLTAHLGTNANVIITSINSVPQVTSISDAFSVYEPLYIDGNSLVLNAYTHAAVYAAGHLGSQGTAPTVTGTGCTGASSNTDTRGSITTSAATACTVTFAASYSTTAPVCTVSSSAAATPAAVNSVSVSALVIGSAALTGTEYYICVQ